MKRIGGALICVCFLIISCFGSAWGGQRQFNVIEEGRTEQGQSFYRVICSSGKMITVFVIDNTMTGQGDACSTSGDSGVDLSLKNFIEALNDFCQCSS